MSCGVEKGRVLGVVWLKWWGQLGAGKQLGKLATGLNCYAGGYWHTGHVVAIGRVVVVVVAGCRSVEVVIG